MDNQRVNYQSTTFDPKCPVHNPRPVPTPSSRPTTSPPQNRYMNHLVEQMNNDVIRLKSENVKSRREASNAQKEINELRAEKNRQEARIFALESKMEEQEMLYHRLHNESSNHFRCLDAKNERREREMSALGLANRINMRRMNFTMDNLNWDLKHLNANSSPRKQANMERILPDFRNETSFY